MAGTDFKAPGPLFDKPTPDLFTLIAKENPDRNFVQVIQEHTNAPVDCIRYTWAQVIQHAQNAAFDIRARWASRLNEEDAKQRVVLPRQPGSTPVVVAILANTSGYELYINIIACTLNRWTVLLISPKNSPAAIEHLLATSASSLLLVDGPNVALSHKMERSIPGLRATHAATIDTLEGDAFSSPLSPLTPEQLRAEMDAPAILLHTSGSTGHPKIITWTHNFMLSPVRFHRKMGQHFVGLPFYSIAPLSHALSIFANFQYLFADGYLVTFVTTPTPIPPSAAALIRYLPFIQGGIIVVPPSILQELYSLGPEAVKAVAGSITLAMFGGAPLKKEVGDSLVAAGLSIGTGYGSTETSSVINFVRPGKPEDWEYIELRGGYNFIWRPVDNHSNLREMLVAPSATDCPAVINNENPKAYATSDIWEPHPSVPNLWKFHSRMGDVTVLSNGEKSNNKQIEELLLEDRRIHYVQVFGSGRPMNGVILQPRDSSISASEFLSQIQATIEHANALIPKHSRLVRELILVAPADKPFATTDKATVKKKETLDKFQLEIEAAYEIMEEGGNGEDWAFEGSVSNEKDVKRFVRSAIHQVLGEGVPDGEDLFEHGFDSLLSLRLRSALLSVSKKTVTSTQPMPRNIVYTYPSVNALAAYLLSRSVSNTFDVPGGASERIRGTIAKYSTNFIPHQPGSRPVDGKVVALTGSTGSAGSSILALLLQRSDVKRIYLLNRKGNERQNVRQAKGFKKRGLNAAILEEKKEQIIYLDVDLARSDLGLVDTDYLYLRDNITHIIHAAWHLNFNLILESYERVHIAGVRHLIDLALSSPQARPPRLTFLSTIAAAAMYNGASQEPSVGEMAGQVLIPEEPIDDPSIPLDQGYGQSKYVSERILVNAVEVGLRSTIVRVGQLSGMTTNGAWSSSEHVPILFKSSVAIGMVPVDLPPVRWVPTDIAASVIINEAFQDDTPLQYFAVENPTLTPWATVAGALSSASPKPLKHVSIAAWVEHIRKSNPDPGQVPAVRLLDFYQGMAGGVNTRSALGWEHSVRVAPALAVGRLDEELVAKYVKWQIGPHTHIA
ncbi:hypothetical protein JB92DRAFT_2991783 [Gautieria morchelliformis]|nr:hypothetical protein JB92DRAFT_2991783 [Gautieria morchelliformis]